MPHLASILVSLYIGAIFNDSKVTPPSFSPFKNTLNHVPLQAYLSSCLPSNHFTAVEDADIFYTFPNTSVGVLRVL